MAVINVLLLHDLRLDIAIEPRKKDTISISIAVGFIVHLLSGNGSPGHEEKYYHG